MKWKFLLLFCLVLVPSVSAQAEQQATKPGQCDPANPWHVVAGFNPPADEQRAYWVVDYPELIRVSAPETRETLEQVSVRYPQYTGQAMRRFLVGRNTCTGELGVEAVARQESGGSDQQRQQLATQVATALVPAVVDELREQEQSSSAQPQTVVIQQQAPKPDRRKRIIGSLGALAGAGGMTFINPVYGAISGAPALASFISAVMPDRDEKTRDDPRLTPAEQAAAGEDEAFVKGRLKKWL